jgi:hypothetical protein
MFMGEHSIAIIIYIPFLVSVLTLITEIQSTMATITLATVTKLAIHFDYGFSYIRCEKTNEGTYFNYITIFTHKYCLCCKSMSTVKCR